VSALLDLQVEFTQSAAALIQRARALGYQVTFGQTYRTPEEAQQNADNGTGVANSLHCDRLAIDLNLYDAGRYITDGEGHEQLAIWWKSLGTRYRWGGDFKRRDFNHYSLSPDGVRA